jgi:signal transduction histidine kinase
MSVSSLADPERPRGARRSIRFTFAAMVAVPAVCLILLWVLAVSAMPGSGLAGRFSVHSHRDLVGSALLVGAGLVIVLAAAILMGSFARRLSRDISDLAATAQHLADEQSPQPVERPSGGMHAARADGSAPRSRTKTTEIAQAAAAIASLQQTATAAAASEASLRDGLRQVFVSLARRNQSLLRRQLLLIDALEQKASDPAALADLFSLDHLTTRMRRHAESLGILSGAAPGRSWREPVQIIDVIRGAMAEVEDYKRVTVLTAAEDAVTGPAVADMIHLLAELIENATLFSPSGTRVEVRAGLVAHGFAVEIDDRGLGMEPDQLSEINQRLATPPDFDLADADRLGLFVAGKLAARHGVRVSLRPSPYGGTTAIVLMPHSIVVPAEETETSAQPSAYVEIGRPAGLDLRGAEALALPGRRAAASPPPAADQSATALNGLAAAGQPGAGTYNGLPRRARQANLSPHLRDSPAGVGASGADSGPAPSDGRAPEQARDLAASLQSGWRRGRQTEMPEAQAAADLQAAGQRDPAVPHSEEE